MPTLVFVYNADAGVFNLLVGVAHKVLSPATYPCRLCAVTHGAFGVHKEWREFVAGLGRPVEFLHRDEFRRRYKPADVPLPAVFRAGEDGRAEVWLDAAAVNSARSVADLRRLVADRLRADPPG